MVMGTLGIYTEMAKGEENGKRVSRLRWFALGCLAGVTGVWAICGLLLKNSAPRPVDDAGRPLQPYYLNDYTLGTDELLLMSAYSQASFDARYFGPLSRTTIQSVIVPILTWK
jgi:type IV secretory pathway protease TraF